ncbi:MAG: GNAT family N-acetyltransferase [Pseudomonadota bacterium]
MPQTFVTDRLILRGIRRDDAELIAALLSRADVRRFLGGPVPADHVAGRVAQYVKLGPDQTAWIVQLKVPKRAIGMVILAPHHDEPDPELSYQFHPDTWGQGYATEATRRVRDVALKGLGHARLVAETQVANVASRQLLERLEMSETRRLVRFGADQVIYST